VPRADANDGEKVRVNAGITPHYIKNTGEKLLVPFYGFLKKASHLDGYFLFL